MHLDVLDLRNFYYRSALGRAAQKVIRDQLVEWWPVSHVQGQTVVGYGFAWVGHYVFEKNRPATFKHPWYSLAGDFVMFKDILIGRIEW